LTPSGHAKLSEDPEMGDQFSMNSYLGQRILSLVREGDYAHAGEEQAIELSMSGVERNASRVILDADCGRGGTADYLHKNGWGRVVGIDIEAESIKAARQNHPNARFLVCDVCDVDRRVDDRPDIVCMFNSYYCFKDQSAALGAFLKTAQPHTQLIIFDHVDRGGYQDDPLMDAGEPFLPNPLRLSEVRERMTSTGWQAPDIVEVHDAYIGWYTSLVEKIERARDKIADTVGQRGYEHVHGLYRGLLNTALQKKLGAAIITAIPAP
jgi:SAM-dependent methyltransferase